VGLNIIFIAVSDNFIARYLVDGDFRFAGFLRLAYASTSLRHMADKNNSIPIGNSANGQKILQAIPSAAFRAIPTLSASGLENGAKE